MIEVLLRKSNRWPVVRFEQGSGRVYLHAMPTLDRELAQSVLTGLHLEFFVGGVPHYVSVTRGGSGQEQVDGLSMETELAKCHLGSLIVDSAGHPVEISSAH